MGLERELKLALTPEESAVLEAHLGPPIRVTSQQNLYLDSAEGHLRREQIGLRLRIERSRAAESSGTRFILSLKGPSRRKGELVERTEEEAEIDRAVAERIQAGGLDPHTSDLPGLAPAARRLGIRQVICLGSVENERRVLALPLPDERSAELDLDRTRYPDGNIDWEVELELPEGQSGPVQRLRDLFTELGIAWRPHSEGKYSRFLKRRRQP